MNISQAIRDYHWINISCSEGDLKHFHSLVSALLNMCIATYTKPGRSKKEVPQVVEPQKIRGRMDGT